MIAPGMIRKMGKAYSDRAMCKDCRIHFQDGAWSNGFVAFKEPLPKHIDTDRYDVKEHDFWSEVEKNMLMGNVQVQVWPVEIRPIYDDGMRIVRLSDGNSLDVWVNAGYLSAVLKREPTATFHTAIKAVQRNQKGAPIIAKNGPAFAMVMPMTFDDDAALARAMTGSEWSIVNDHLPSARNFTLVNELATMLPPRPGGKWHVVEHDGLTLEICRSGRNNKERVLHVRMAGRGAMSHISLYDGRGMRG